MSNPFLHDYLHEAAGLTAAAMTRDGLEAYQLAQLKRQIAFAKANSPFYAKLYAGLNPNDLRRLTDFSGWPQTAPRDLAARNSEFLCTSQRAVWRVITLQTSGTSGLPKKLYFSQNDLDKTARYFHFSLKQLAQSCKNLLVLMPGGVPGSVGDILARALADLPIQCHQFGIITNFAATMQAIRDFKIDFIIGIPSQVLNLCRYSMQHGGLGNQIKNVLFGADYISPFCAQTVAQNWRCNIIKHYGSTESALGAAVNCPSFTGCHIREAELLFEAVDPVTKRPVADGEFGELVISSLNYECMPLLRYNTGDIGALSQKPCACGSVLKRLVKMRPRHTILLDDDTFLDINELDEMLYKIPGLDYFEAEVINAADSRAAVLIIKLNEALTFKLKSSIETVLSAKFNSAIARNLLKIKVAPVAGLTFSNPYVLKRKITDLRA